MDYTNIKTFDDVFVATGVTEEQFAAKINGMDPDTAAYEKLKLVAKAINGDWTPDFSDGDQGKWEPWFYFRDSAFDFAVGWHQYSFVGSRLCFETEEKAEYAATTFIDEYNAFLK